MWRTAAAEQLRPMLAATAATLTAAGLPARPGTLLADCGYWSIANLTELPDAPQQLIPPGRHGRQGKPRKDGKPSASRSDGLRAAMTAKLASAASKALYALRRQTIEPVFGQIKDTPVQRGGSSAEGWPPAMPSGSCCAAPTPAQALAPSRSRPAPTPLAI